MERGFDEDDIRDHVNGLTGVLYLDTDEQTYHLVTDNRVIVIRERNGKRIVLTAYPNEDPERYQTIQYRMLKG